MYGRYSRDFGGDKKLEPKAFIQPTTIEEIRTIFTENTKMKIAVRGMAHTTGGHTLAENGVVVDMTLFSKIGVIQYIRHIQTIEIQAGALWKDVFKYCLLQGVAPPVYADWLELTVGGTISTGGVGQCSFKKGLQIDNVIQLEIITALGDILICSRQENASLFDLARGGLGQFGIITRVWIRLEPAPKHVNVCKLLYWDLESFLQAQTGLTYHPKIDAIQSHIVGSDKETLEKRLSTALPAVLYDALPKQKQYFVLEVMQYTDATMSGYDFKTSIQAATRHNASYIFQSNAPFEQHIHRIPPVLEHPLEKNHPKHHHGCFFISAEKIFAVLKRILHQEDHIDAMGQGVILVIPMKRSLISTPYFMLPDGEDLFLVGILRRHVPPCHFDTLVALNEALYSLVSTEGGTIYPVGSGSYLMHPDYWQRHYGMYYQKVTTIKREYDRDNQLIPGIRLSHL
jgi:cytokinin dehydrogenase